MNTAEAARLCLTDLYFLVSSVLYDEDQHKYGEMHKWMCSTVGKHSSRRELWLLPRNHFKSTILTIGYAIQQILRDPWISILLLSSKDEHALGFSKEIRKQFKYNERLHELFPPWRMDNDFGSAGEWETPARSFFAKTRGRREPSIVAAGFKARLASKHYDLGLLDDCMDEEDTSELGLADALANYRKVIPLIDEPKDGGQIIMCGTRKHFSDLYQNVLDSGSYVAYVRHGLQAEATSCDAPECRAALPHSKADFLTGTPCEPKRMDRAAFDTKLKECQTDAKLGVGYFWHEYMNLPFSPSDRKFQPGWFVKVQDRQIPGASEPFSPLSKWITLDTAWKDDENPSGYDYTVIVVGGFDEFGRLYILDILRDRDWTEKRGIEAIVTAMKAYGINRVMMEKVGEVTTTVNLRDACRLAGIPVQIAIQKRGGRGSKNKFERIMACQYAFESGRVFFRDRSQHIEAAIAEFCNLGRWTNDDIADAISMFFDEQVKVLAPVRDSGKLWANPLRPMSYDSNWRRSASRTDPLGRFGQNGPAELRQAFDPTEAASAHWSIPKH